MFKCLIEVEEGSHSKLTSHGSLLLYRPSSPCRSASPFRTQVISTAVYISPITRPSSLNWELVSVLVCRPQLHRSQAAEVLQTQQVRTRAHRAPPATRPHLGIRGRRAACHLSNHLILCCPLLFPPSIFPSISIYNESALPIRWPLHQVKFWIQTEEEAGLP